MVGELHGQEEEEEEEAAVSGVDERLGELLRLGSTPPTREGTREGEVVSGSSRSPFSELWSGVCRGDGRMLFKGVVQPGWAFKIQFFQGKGLGLCVEQCPDNQKEDDLLIRETLHTDLLFRGFDDPVTKKNYTGLDVCTLS